MLGIVCDCEGLLVKQAALAVCTVCRKTYPTAEVELVMKLLQMADREHDNDGKPANENERRMAIRKAGTKLARLKLRVMEIRPPAPVPQPPQPAHAGWRVTVTTTTDSGTGWTGVNVVYRTNIA